MRLLAVCFILLSGSALATSEIRITTGLTAFPAYEVTPYAQSVWFEPARSGEGWFFGSIPSPTGGAPLTAAAYYAYASDGRPTWYLMTGQYVPNAPLDQFHTGIVGRLTAPMLESSGGACPECMYRAPTTTESAYGVAEISYTATTQAQVKVLGEVITTIQPIDLSVTRPLAAAIPGRWRYVNRSETLESGVTLLSEFQCDIAILTTTNPTRDDRWEPDPADPQRAELLPEQAASWYRVDGSNCTSNSIFDAHFYLAGSDIRGLSLRAPGATAITETVAGRPVTLGYKVRRASLLLTMHPLTPNTMVIRRWTVGATPGADRLRSEYLLTRLP